MKKFNSYSSLKALLAGNFQHMNVNQVNVPATLNTSYRLQKTFFSDREEAFLLSSAPAAKVNLNLAYNINKLTIGTNFIYYGKMQSKGFGWTGYAALAGTGEPGDPAISGSFAGIDPYVDEDQYLDANYVGNGVSICRYLAIPLN
jgi:iron complex outermembrane receptor protein